MKRERLKIAVLVDLPISAQAGGHVKMWERLARAAAHSHLPIDLTVYGSGAGQTVPYAPHVRFLQLPPVFSTARLKFLPYMPDHTDLARWHRQLARHLHSYDVVHTTDAFFAFARTAEQLRRKRGRKQMVSADFSLVHSFHTDQPAYAEIFTARSLETWWGRGRLSRFLTQTLRIPRLAAQQMRARLAKHLRYCDYVLATRPEDRALAERQSGAAKVSRLRLGVDRTIFRPNAAGRAELCARYGIQADHLLILFVGRLDIGKNIYPLLTACAQLRRAGYKLHLFAAGLGPAATDITAQLGDDATLCGFVGEQELATLYAGADILAVPSEVEIGSLVLVEALACGLPVLASAASDLASLYGTTPAVRAVAGGAEGWQEALAKLMTDPQCYPAMRAAAQDYGQQKVADWSAILREDLFPIWQAAGAGKL